MRSRATGGALTGRRLYDYSTMDRPVFLNLAAQALQAHTLREMSVEILFCPT